MPDGWSAGDAGSDDAELVVRAREDRDAFGELYRRYLPRVYAYCLYRLGTHEQAEDATSQVFLKVLAALPGHRPERSFRAWLFTIAQHVVVDCYRTRRDVASLTVVADRVDTGPLPEETAIARDQTARLLDLLTEEQRRVMELRLAGLTGVEIAAVLGKKLSAVKMAQQRALERMRTAFAATERVVSTGQERCDERA